MTTIKIQEMVDAFEVYERQGVFNDRDRNDKFLRYLLDRSIVPSFAPYQYSVKEDGKEVSRRKEWDEFTDEQKAEYKNFYSVWSGDWYKLDDSITVPTRKSYQYSHKREDQILRHAELQKLICKLPPVIMDQVLIYAIVIYALRALDADFDSETPAFNEFYKNYRDLVVSTYEQYV